MNKEILQFFKQEDKKVIFIGDELNIWISERFKNFSCLKVSNIVNTLAIFNMEITANGKKYKSGYFLPRLINIEPTEVLSDSIDGSKYVKLVLKKNNVFIQSTELIQTQTVAYVAFYEYINSANIPYFIDYDQKALLFDRITASTGVHFNVDHAIFEILFAQLNRDQNNIMTQFRLTDMKNKSKQIPLSDVNHAGLSTTSRLIGSYFDDGLNAALVENNYNPSTIENIMRM